MTVDPLAYLFSLEQFGIKFGLDNIRAIVDELGRPHEAFASVHVAGTNGKGSVTAMVESVLRAAGVRTGRYTSPHLVHLTERVAVNGQRVSEASLCAAVDDVRTAVAALRQRGRLAVHPTFFEVTTAAAFEVFRREQVQVAVCEVGLGGRLDATNVLSPMVSAITSIGLDHQQYLGGTIADIAAEKAGIIKAGVPVVVGNVDEVAMGAIAGIASERPAPLIRASDGVSVGPGAPTASGAQRFALQTPHADYGRVELALAGAHQVDNAVVATRVIEALAPAYRVSVEEVREGLATVRWPGRLERVACGPGRVALLDAAHNPSGAEALARFLARRDACPLVFAAMKDKDAAGILGALGGSVSALVVTRASHPRAANPRDLATLAATLLPGVPCEVADDPLDALDAAWRHGPEIVVAGSIFLLGDVIKGLGRS